MADQRIQYTEKMVGNGHPTLSDTLNRLSLVAHNSDGSHKGYVEALQEGSFAATLAAVPVTTQIVITTVIEVAGPLTISHPIEAKPGGLIVVTSGIVTINGPFSCGLFQCFDGDGSITFGSGSVVEVHPEWFGGSIIKSLMACSSIKLQPDTIYTSDSTAIFAGNLKLTGNNSTIKAAAELSSSSAKALIASDNVKQSGTPTPFNVVAKSSSFTIPAGMSLSVGDMAYLYNTTTALYSTTYYDGQYVVIESISGGTAYTNVPFYASFQVDAYRVYNPVTVNITGVTFDLSDTANNTLSAGNSHGLSITANSILVQDCKFIGNEYAAAGAFLYGDSVSVRDCQAHGFLNIQGDTRPGRMGYGVAVVGNNCLVSGGVYTNNKHNITSGITTVGNSGMTVNVVYENLTATQDMDKYNTDVTLPSGTEKWFGASLDFHANALTSTIRNCVVKAPNTLINARHPSIKIIDSHLEQTAVAVGTWGAVTGFEKLWYGVSITNSNIILQSQPVYWFINTLTTASYINKLTIESCSITGCSYPVHFSIGSGAGTISINGFDLLNSFVSAPAKLWSNTNNTTTKNLNISGNRYYLDASTVTTTIGNGTMTGVNITNNTFDTSAGLGGTFIFDFRNGTLTDIEFSGNTLTGGLSTYSSTGVTTNITNFKIANNRINKPASGNCIVIDKNVSGTINVVGCSIENNLLKVDSLGTGTNYAINLANTPTIATTLLIIGNVISTGGTGTTAIGGGTTKLLAVGNAYFGSLGTVNAASTGNAAI